MKLKAAIPILLCLIALPALACQTVMGALGGTPTPPVPEIPTVEGVPELPTGLPDELATALPEGTLPALATEFFSGEAPEDVPVVEPNENFFGAEGTVSYDTTTAFDEVVAFYKAEMPANGWEDAGNNVEFGDTAILNFSKDGRSAIVTLSVSQGKTIVLIVVSGG
jgi:hypothetical protein